MCLYLLEEVFVSIFPFSETDGLRALLYLRVFRED